MMRPAIAPTPDAGPSGELLLGELAPRLHPSFVRRPRLVEPLLSSSPAQVVMLTGSAGYSKSTCLAEWAEEDVRPFAWVAASHRHDDPALLVASIVEAIDRIEPIDSAVLAALASPKPSISGVVLPRLSEALRGQARGFVLVIDDVHALSAPEAFEVIKTVIDCLPPESQLALASRAEPPLGLGRLRANRRLLELTYQDLAMTRSESGELLQRLGVELSPGQLDVIFERTEGWPAALYLAALTLADQKNLAAAVASFAGDDRVIVDYLRDEFLSGVGPGQLDFLIRTSVLDELTGPSCDALLERSGSGEILRRLARSNALVISLDRNDDRYRYHHLFAEMLHSELRRREPELEPDLHERASRWYAAESDSDRAIEHAIASGQTDWSGELIWDALPEMGARGRMATIECWLERLGEERIESSALLSLAGAHCYLALGDGDRAAHCARVALTKAPEHAAEGGRAIEADILGLKAMLSDQGVVQMGKDAARASELYPADDTWQVPAYLYRGVSSHLHGHVERALPLLQEGARRGAVLAPVIQALCLAQLCLIALDDDDWDAASALADQAREQVRRCGLSDYPIMALVFAASALVVAHRGQVERAKKELTQALRLNSQLTHAPPWLEIETRLLLFRACARLDELSTGRELLDGVSELMEGERGATVLGAWLKEARDSLESLESSILEERRREWSLTTAELRTLQYLQSHLSFREIGDRIFVSPNTVKTQAQAVYRKLDVTSRTEAVEAAREAGLLGDDPLRKT